MSRILPFILDRCLAPIVAQDSVTIKSDPSDVSRPRSNAAEPDPAAREDGRNL